MSLIKYGFTGTRSGLNKNQVDSINKLFSSNVDDTIELHHGDCVGADKDMHDLCVIKNIKVIIHPPNDDKLRAFCKSDNILGELPYLKRNKKIVDDTSQMPLTMLSVPTKSRKVPTVFTCLSHRLDPKQSQPLSVFLQKRHGLP